MGRNSQLHREVNKFLLCVSTRKLSLHSFPRDLQSDDGFFRASVSPAVMGR